MSNISTVYRVKQPTKLQVAKAILALLILLFTMNSVFTIPNIPIWFYILNTAVPAVLVPIFALALVVLLEIAVVTLNDRTTTGIDIIELVFGIGAIVVSLYAVIVPQGGVYWVIIPILFFGGILALLVLGNTILSQLHIFED